MFSLMPLPFSKNALKPYMSEETLTFHHDKHHQTYVDNLNKLIADTKFEDMSLEQIIKQSSYNVEHIGIFNNAAQVFNHNFFWECISPNGNKKPNPALLKKIEETFGSYENWQKEFKTAATSQFGSGWAWLAEDKDGQLKIMKTSNADNPIAHDMTPLMTIDVWEHAYYLDYQNRRADFVDAFLNHLINWK